METLKSVYGLLSRQIKPLRTETVNIQSSEGRVLSQAVMAPNAHPRFSNSAMDGYVFSDADLEPCELGCQVGGTIAAGQNDAPRVHPGAPLRIFTGAAIPPGGVAVRLQENVQEMADGKISWANQVSQHANIRLMGEDILEGTQLLDRGDIIDAPSLLALANLRVQKVSVFRRPKIALATSGSELVSVDGPEPTRSQVVDGNRIFLTHQLGTDGDLIEVFPRLEDTVDAVEHFITKIPSFDVVICCGGTSVGKFDILGQKLREHGNVLVDRVAVKPGKPLLIGHIGQTVFIGLPGNPLSTFVGYELFVRPLLRLLTGENRVFPGIQMRPVATSLSANGSRLNFLRAHEGADGELSVAVKQGSGALSGLLSCNRLILRPPNCRGLAAETLVPSIGIGKQSLSVTYDEFCDAYETVSFANEDDLV